MKDIAADEFESVLVQLMTLIILCLLSLCLVPLVIVNSEVSGDREVQRTMLELLNQLDGFSSDDRIKVTCTNIHLSSTMYGTSLGSTHQSLDLF